MRCLPVCSIPSKCPFVGACGDRSSQVINTREATIALISKTPSLVRGQLLESRELTTVPPQQQSAVPSLCHNTSRSLVRLRIDKRVRLIYNGNNKINMQDEDGDARHCKTTDKQVCLGR